LLPTLTKAKGLLTDGVQLAMLFQLSSTAPRLIRRRPDGGKAGGAAAAGRIARQSADRRNENSCGVWAIISTTHTISPRIKRGCRRRLDVTVLEQMPIIPPQDRKAAGSVGQKSPLSRH